MKIFYNYFSKKVHFVILFLFLSGVSFIAESQIVTDGLNNASTVFTVSGGTYYTGNSAAGDGPASSAFAVEGTHSYGVSNGTAILTSGNINTSAYSGISLNFRLASFSISNATNGADGGDIATVEVSPNGGTNWYSTLRVLGNNNAYWSYAGGAGVASTPYDGNATSVDFAPTGGGSRTTDGYSTVTITSLPAAANLRVRITALNNSANERWLIDNFSINGTFAGKVTQANGNWDNGATWVGGVAPANNESVLIHHNVFTNGARTRDASTVTIISNTGILRTNATFTNSGTTTVNGTFQIEEGGWATGNNFVYGAAGTLNFNPNVTTNYAVNNDVFWPAASGPFNVNVLNGGLTLNVSRTVAGTFSTANSGTLGISFPAAILTINGTCLINAGGYFNNGPMYGGSSLLRYNSGGNYNRNPEWGSATPATQGYPYNVQISGNTALIPGANGGNNMNLEAGGILTIDAGSSFYMDFGALDMNFPIRILGDVNCAGNLSLSNNNNGDLKVRGNISFTGAYSFNANNRAVYFTKNGVQTISASTKPVFHYIVYEPVSGSTTIQLSGTDIDVRAPLTGNVIAFSSATDVFDINGRTLTLGTAAVANVIAGLGTFKGSATSNMSFLGTGSIGTLRFTTGSQNLGNLTVNRTSGAIAATLGTPLTLNAATGLTLTSGLLEIAANDLSFASASAASAGSANSFVIASGTGYVRKIFTAAGSFTYPVGDNTSTAEYSPATVSFTGGSYSTANAGIRVVDAAHPNMAGADYVTRYWQLNTSGISGATYVVAGTYVDADIVGTETSMNGARYDGSSPWIEGAAVNAVSNIATVSGQTTFTATNDFTAGHPLPPVPTGTISGTSPACTSTLLTISSTAPSGETYYWQTSPTGTSTANAGSTYSATASGTYYVRSRNNTTLYWSTATAGYAVVVNAQIVISTQPANITVTSPTSASFTVATSAGTISSYQWQLYDGTAWNNVVNGAPYSGATTATLTINPTNVSLDANNYRCVLTGASPCTNVTSNAATLTVLQGPCATETFTNIPASSGTYANRTWVGDNGGTWNATNARTDQTLTGRAIATDATGSVTAPTVPGGMGTLSFNYVRAFTGTGARTIQVWINGSQFGANITVNPSSDVVQSYSALVNFAGSVDLQLRTSGNQIKIDDVSWTCYSGCTPVQTIAGFTPTDGPQGTIVTITGTGFIAGASVKFGGVSATVVNVINSTTITAEVPSNAISGPVTVTQSGCDEISTGSFTVLSANSNCGTGAVPGSNGLIISEVFDSNVGSLSYVEIFNPTSGSINLTNYILRIATGSNSDYSLGTGNLASGATMVISIGDASVSGSSSCSVTTALNYPSGSGFNGNDQVILRLSGADHDVVDNPNYPGPNPPTGDNKRGFTQTRLPGFTTPRTTFVPAEWTNADPESCDNLGIPPSSVTSTNVTINTQPNDVSACGAALSFSVNATGNPSIGTYIWRYQAPGSSTWSLVSSLNGTNGLTVTGSGTAAISITGNTAILADYQFYAEITTGGTPSCSRYSRAVQYTYLSYPSYRSIVTSGNWSAVGTWQIYNTNTSTWVAACTYPVSINSDNVTIQTGHNITLDLDVSIDRVTVETGATLQSSPNAQLTILNGGSGADLILAGTATYIDRANSANSISFASGATWQMSSTSTFIKTNSSSAADLRDNYEGGIANIPSGASWIYRYNADGNPAVTTVGMYYPNLYFESVSGAYNWNGFTTALTGGAGGYCTVKGNLSVGTTGTGTVSVSNSNINSQPMLVLGNAIIAANCTFTNVSYDGLIDTDHGNGTGLEVKGDFTVNGTFTNNGGTAQTGNLVFSGTGTQTVSGSGTMNLEDVIINNTTASANVLVNKSFSIPGTLSFGNAAAKLSLNTGNITLKSTAARTANVSAVPATNTILYPGTGRFIVERFISAFKNWEFVSAPVTETAAPNIYDSWQESGATPAGYGTRITGPGATVANGLDAAVAGVNLYSMKYQAAPANVAYTNVTNTKTTAVNLKSGFFLFVRGDRTVMPGTAVPGAITTLRSKGKLFVGNGGAEQPPASAGAAGNWISVGNPFASAVDFTQLKAASANINNSFNVWDPSLYGSYGLGGYQTVAGATGFIATPGASSLYTTGTDYRAIQSGQAFYVQASGAASIPFNETMKVGGSRLAHRTAQERPGADPASISIFSTLLYNQAGRIADGNRVVFDDSYSGAINADDAQKLMNSGENFAISKSGKLLAVEARETLSPKDTIRFEMNNLTAQRYKLVFAVQHIPDAAQYRAMLVDNFTGNRTPVSLTDSTYFNFEVTNDAKSKSKDRFYVVFKFISRVQIPLTTAERNADKSVTVKWTASDEEEVYNYQIERSFDGTIFTGIAFKNLFQSYSFLDETLGFSGAYYRIKAVHNDAFVKYGPTVFVPEISRERFIKIVSNPVNEGTIGVEFRNQELGSYLIKLLDASGKTVLTKAIDIRGYRLVVNLPFNNLAKGIYFLRVDYAGEIRYTDKIMKY